MPVAKVNVGRVIPDNTMRSLDGSQDTTSWALLTTSDIQSTDDPNNLETSKAMSGREFQFRGGTPSGSGLSNPNDGCLYNFTLKDPDTGATIDPKAGSIIGVEFYFKFGTNVPDTQNDQFHCAVADTNKTTLRSVFLLELIATHRYPLTPTRLVMFT